MSWLKSSAFLISVLLLQSCGQPHPNSGFGVKDDRILGGQAVSANSEVARSVVMLYGEKESGESFTCSGTFIAEGVILTAGHCIGAKPEAMSIFYGVNPFDDTDSVSIPVSSAIIHEDYKKSKTERNDVALIFFKHGLPVGAKALSIATAPEFLSTKEVVLTGFGRTQSPADDSADRVINLQWVSMLVDPSGIADKMFALDQSKGKGACFGDSGGPALLNSRDGLKIVGIASAVVGTNEDCRDIGVYTRADAYTDWVLKHLPSPNKN